jgi:L-ascorbate metabolism protein UlaG (beta-lactamase superfamily)
MTGRLTFIGTATTLIEYDGFTLLTDPNFLHRGQKVYLGKGLFSTRRTEPAMQPEDLPPLDAVVLSHLHGDHFDRVAKERLDKGLPIVSTTSAASTLQDWGFARAVGLTTWQTHELTSASGSTVRITAAPGQHARGVLRAVLPAVNGSVLQFSGSTAAPPLTIYITGDTLLIDDLREVPRRHPDIDVGLWHLGGTRIPGILGLGLMVTMDGREGAELLDIVRPPHHGADPLRRLRRVHLAAVGLPRRGRAPRAAGRAAGRAGREPRAPRAGGRRLTQPPGPPATRDYPGARTQSSLPSGSARTVQGTSPWPTSASVAPSPRSRSTSASWSSPG